jgi:predicted ATPase
MAYRKQLTRLKAPYLKRILIEPARVADWEKYPWNLPIFHNHDFDLEFTTPITIIVGENGTGKSTLLEAIGALAGYDEAGGGKGYMPIDHSRAIDKSGAALAETLRGHWLPKVTAGWFFRAESFYAVARYLDQAALDAHQAPPDFLSWSHGEGFIRFFEERCRRQGIYILDEPESALSPTRQIELLKMLRRMDLSGTAQVIMATHSPLLMACPGAKLMRISRFGLDPADYRDTDHFRMMREFCMEPDRFITDALLEDDE